MTWIISGSFLYSFKNCPVISWHSQSPPINSEFAIASEEFWDNTKTRALFFAKSDDNSNNVWNAAQNEGMAGLDNNNANNDNIDGARPDL